LRALVTQAFTPRSVALLSEHITAIATGLLDEVAAQGAMDFIDDFAYPLPMLVIAELLGVPQQDRARFKAWSDAVIGVAGMGGSPRAEMIAYFRQIIEQRRLAPQGDLISALLAAEVEGQRLTEQELLGFCVLLLVAGNETTTHLLGNALLCFDDYPEALEQLRADLALIPEAIEEVLRYRSPVQMMFRQVVADVELSGQYLHTGQWAVAQIGSANRDEAQFPDPDRFDIRRAPNRHLAFGHGIHFCLGAPLARLEAKIALTVLLERFREIERNHDVAVEAIGSSIVFGVKHLPVTFQAHSR
jgi:cytochrome P450